MGYSCGLVRGVRFGERKPALGVEPQTAEKAILELLSVGRLATVGPRSFCSSTADVRSCIPDCLRNSGIS